LKRFQETGQNHFLTFSCYHRQPKLAAPEACYVFVSALERVRQSYRLCVYGYVVMPEHVHLLVNEPERSTLAQALKSLKQGVARRLALRAEEPFWQERYYDFNVWSERKFVEKLRYLHFASLWRAAWSRNRRIGRGAAFVITQPEKPDPSKSSPSGRRADASGQGCFLR
jgi:putative transposase